MSTYESGRTGLLDDGRTEDGGEAMTATTATNGKTGVATEQGPETEADAGHDLGGGAAAGAAKGEIEAVPGYQRPGGESAASGAVATAGPQLDAWFASFGEAAGLDDAVRQQELTAKVIEVVIGTDDRVRINNTTDYPWRAICSLSMTAADGSGWIGTGWLVAPRTIITAGHCVYMHDRGGWVSSVRVMPGRNGSATETPFPSCVATHVRTTTAWIQSRDSNQDYGCIILPQSFMNYSSLGTFGFANLNDLQGLTVNISGYPGDKPAGTQWFHSRQIKSVSDRRFSYDIDTAGGQSGAPVWRLLNGERHAVGIHTNGASTGNSAVRITSAVFDNIMKWKNWYG